MESVQNVIEELATGKIVDMGIRLEFLPPNNVNQHPVTMRTFHTEGFDSGKKNYQVPTSSALLVVRNQKSRYSIDVDGEVEKIETIGNRRKIIVSS
jgi:hypothetical protein